MHLPLPSPAASMSWMLSPLQNFTSCNDVRRTGGNGPIRPAATLHCSRRRLPVLRILSKLVFSHAFEPGVVSFFLWLIWLRRAVCSPATLVGSAGSVSFSGCMADLAPMAAQAPLGPCLRCLRQLRWFHWVCKFECLCLRRLCGRGRRPLAPVVPSAALASMPPLAPLGPQAPLAPLLPALVPLAPPAVPAPTASVDSAVSTGYATHKMKLSVGCAVHPAPQPPI